MIPDKTTREILIRIMQAATAMHVADAEQDSRGWWSAFVKCQAAKRELREYLASRETAIRKESA